MKERLVTSWQGIGCVSLRGSKGRARSWGMAGSAG